MTNTLTRAAVTPDTVRVGDGFTEGVGSDRYAFTVVRVSDTGLTIWLTGDTARQVGDYFGSQEWEYEPNPDGRELVARWSRAKRRFVAHGRQLGFGRHAYQDPSF